MLHLPKSGVLLACGLACSVGSAQSHRNLLASSLSVVRRHNSLRNGNRLRCQLAQQSHSSLRYHWATILDRCSGIPAFGLGWDSPQQSLGLAIRCYRGRYRVSAGMAVHAAFSVITLRDAFGRSGRCDSQPLREGIR